jgi:hypothetical protein
MSPQIGQTKQPLEFYNGQQFLGSESEFNFENPHFS